MNALHLYPEVREKREMDECLVDIKEDREQKLDNNDALRMLRNISVLNSENWTSKNQV